MNATVKEWIQKAEKDYATARRELQATEEQNFDAVCFHAQQCIEKLMKGLLIHQGITPVRTHDLSYIDQTLSTACSDWSWPREDLRFLTRAAVEFRYPGEAADQEEANLAFDIATKIRQKLLSLFHSS
jgi:HEPN domain-containing protein